MSYSVVVTPFFEKELKRLKKKYPSLPRDLEPVISLIELQPEQGISLGKNCFKIRLGIKSKGKGKSGGARIITLVKISGGKVFLLALYDKSERTDIDSQELDRLIAEVK